MKTKYFAIGVTALLIMAASARAADVTGKWTAQAGDVQITLTFKVAGATITGTVDNPQGGPAEIKDGKIDGDNISFTAVRRMGETEIKLLWKGKVAGDEIRFSREVQGGMGGPGGGAMEIIAQKAK